MYTYPFMSFWNKVMIFFYETNLTEMAIQDKEPATFLTTKVPIVNQQPSGKHKKKLV